MFVYTSTLLGLYFIIITSMVVSCSAYSIPQKLSRSNFIQQCQSNVYGTLAFIATSSTITIIPSSCEAFDGSGSSAYSGKNAASKADLKKSYQKRIIADVRDFVILGNAISEGKVDGIAWVNFFIEFQRREADESGRTYAALVDLVGSKDLSGCGILLASSYGKPGKPAESLPTVKKYNAMAKSFDSIKAAGKKGDLAKAKSSWMKASEVLSEFLESVELPSSLKDPIYT